MHTTKEKDVIHTNAPDAIIYCIIQYLIYYSKYFIASMTEAGAMQEKAKEERIEYRIRKRKGEEGRGRKRKEEEGREKE